MASSSLMGKRSLEEMDEGSDRGASDDKDVCSCDDGGESMVGPLFGSTPVSRISPV